MAKNIPNPFGSIRDDGVKMAQSGGVAKGRPNRVAQPTPRGDGLKQAWTDQTRRPSELVDTAAARKRVR